MSSSSPIAIIITLLGALAFGVVVGWVTYRTLRNSTVNGISDIAAVIGAVGGAAVTTLFPQGNILFGGYCIGLAIGFFAYLRTAVKMAQEHGDEKARRIEWLGSDPVEHSERTRAGGQGLPPDA